MAPVRRPVMSSSAALLLLACSLLWPANAFIGIIGGGKGRGACETTGGFCFTQDACCEDFTCEKASQATYGRCTPNKAQLMSHQRGAGSDCDSDADCPAGQCCLQEAAAAAATAGYRGRRVCRRPVSGGGSCSGESAENLFQQYYSGLFRRKRSNQ